MIKTENRHILRGDILAARDRLSASELESKSGVITSRIIAQPEVVAARTVLIYMHFRSEVRTMEIIRWMLVQGKIVSIPVTFPNLSRIEAVRITDPDKEVAPGYYGIPEPLPALVEKRNFSPRDIELVVAPGSVFDRFGGRLGYGGGYYDRFFTTGAAGAVRMGLAFEIQMVEKVPLEPHDQLMDFVVTEDNLYDCRRNIYA